jgi:hypothetical protein
MLDSPALPWNDERGGLYSKQTLVERESMGTAPVTTKSPSE